MKRFASVALVAVACFACAAANYRSDEIVGRVVDADTKLPLAAVNVVVQWPLEGGIEGHSFDLLHVEEAVTDASGAFRISAWGPIPRPSNGHLGWSDPKYLLFKAGYRPQVVGNMSPVDGRVWPNDWPKNGELRSARWNGKTFPLVRVASDPADYTRTVLPILTGGTTYLYTSTGCWWKHVPRFVKAVDNEMRLANESGVTSTGDFRLAALLRLKQCAPFDEFLKAYKAAP